MKQQLGIYFCIFIVIFSILFSCKRNRTCLCSDTTMHRVVNYSLNRTTHKQAKNLCDQYRLNGMDTCYLR